MIADASVELGTGSKVLLFFPCPSCGHRVMGNYCSNCGERVTELSKMDCIRVDLTVAAGILETALEDIAESIYRKGMAAGVPEKKITELLKERFDVPERVKPRCNG